jgi:hypothetical protein
MLVFYPNFEVEFIKRQANMVAHTQTKTSYSQSSHCLFVLISLCIESILINEMN